MFTKKYQLRMTILILQYKKNILAYQNHYYGYGNLIQSPYIYSFMFITRIMRTKQSRVFYCECSFKFQKEFIVKLVTYIRKGATWYYSCMVYFLLALRLNQDSCCEFIHFLNANNWRINLIFNDITKYRV